VKELGGKPKITRFKGLGEISPKEFAQFLGKQIRLRCWRTATSRIRPARRVRPDLRFLHGQDTPERKDYIMDKLVVPVEE
jgi:topoisomerase-4 subunit B